MDLFIARYWTFSIPNKMKTSIVCTDKYPHSFPEGITTIRCCNQALTTLPSSFPSTLKYLDVGKVVKHILEHLPEGLETFIANTSLRMIPRLPRNLKVLQLEYLSAVDYIPPFPYGIEELTIHKLDRVGYIPDLPPTLRKLKLTANANLRDLPVFPEGLEELVLEYGRFETLPPLPSTLKKLKISRCHNVQYIPTLPPSLVDCNISYCNIRKLQVFPETIQHLTLDGLGLHTIPSLPPKLNVLDIRYAKILELPELPETLRCIDVSHCDALRAIPDLPPALETLWMNHTTMRIIPYFPKSLLYLSTTACPRLWIKQHQLETLKNYNQRFEVIRAQLRQVSRAMAIKKELYARVMFHPKILQKIIRHIPESEDPTPYFENEEFKMDLMNLDI